MPENLVPVGRVTAIYARENGQGMAFPPPVDRLLADVALPPLASVPAAVTASTAVRTADPTGGDGDRVVQLVTREPHAKSAAGPAGSEEGEIQPPRPPSGSRNKPALKRVK